MNRAGSDSVRVLAVDLGATSGRVASVDLAADEPSVEIVHRFPNGAVPGPDGSLRWDWAGLMTEVERGLALGREAGPVASIGVDTWGVDYGLIDRSGRLLSDPYSHRDRRTDGWRDLAEAIGPDRLYRISGIQLLGINTVFQVAAHDRAELERADRLLLLGDLVVHHLTGWVGAERSMASTTGLLDAATGRWSPELVEAVGLRPELLPEVSPAGTRAGSWRGTPVHLVGSHDTASAFVALPSEPDRPEHDRPEPDRPEPGAGASAGADPSTVFVSTGTWIIVGMERATADTGPEARAANFSNEAGAHGGIRFLKNVIGFWLLEQCRPGWGHPPTDQLLAEAAAVTEPVPVFDATDERFVAPADMEAEIRVAAGLGPDASRAVVVRSAVESMAAAVGRVVEELAELVGPQPGRLVVVGGGARSALLIDALERRVPLPVTVGSTEATALGNAVSQGIAMGRFADLGAGRRWLTGSSADRPPRTP